MVDQVRDQPQIKHESLGSELLPESKCHTKYLTVLSERPEMTKIYPGWTRIFYVSLQDIHDCQKTPKSEPADELLH